MKKATLRSMVLGLGLTALFLGGLHASTFADRVNIPFDFRVGNRSLSAGDYLVHQDFGKPYAYLENVKTGRRIQVLRASDHWEPGHAILTFATDGTAHVLKEVH